MRIATVIWAREVKLDQFLAKELGSTVIASYREKWLGLRLPAVLRYPFQAFDTLRRLSKEKPDIILVMSPPIFAPLIVWFYAVIKGAKFVIDTHTAGFLDTKWKPFHPFFRFLARKAVLNTVHNEKNLALLERWGIGNGHVLAFYNPLPSELPMAGTEELPERIRQALSGNNPKVLMVNRFANDDAWQETIETAELFPEAVFFITGDDRKMKDMDRSLPVNAILTGYLEHPSFMRLMNECDAVLALTKRPDTVLWSIREAMALGKPFVTTDSAVLRNCYGEAGIFTSMEPGDMKAKLEKAFAEKAEIKERIAGFLKKDRERWAKDVRFVKEKTGIS